MKFVLILPFLLMACGKPNQITDRQVELMLDLCSAQGKRLNIFNSQIVSRADCE